MPKNLKGGGRNLKPSVFCPKSSEEQKKRRSSRPQIVLYIRISPLLLENFVHLSADGPRPAMAEAFLKWGAQN